MLFNIFPQFFLVQIFFSKFPISKPDLVLPHTNTQSLLSGYYELAGGIEYIMICFCAHYIHIFTGEKLTKPSLRFTASQKKRVAISRWAEIAKTFFQFEILNLITLSAGLQTFARIFYCIAYKMFQQKSERSRIICLAVFCFGRLRVKTWWFATHIKHPLNAYNKHWYGKFFE